MTHPKRYPLLAASCAIVCLMGCTTTPSTDKTAALIEAQRLIPSLHEVSAQQPYQDLPWWEEVGGQTLKQLVDTGLQRNTDIQVALTHVQEARAGLTAQKSALWPSVGVNGAYVNTHTELPAPVKQGKPDTRAWQANVAIDWELDLFGRNQQSADAAQLDVLRSEAGVAGARLVLISEIAQQFVVYQGATRKLARLDTLIALQAASQHMVQHQAREGTVSTLEVASNQARLNELQAQRPGLLALQTLTATHIARLTSSSPDEVAQLLRQTNPAQHDWSLPGPVPSGQPVELLERRPDIMAARSAWRASQARLSAAKTDLLPRFFLSLLTGRQDLRLNGMDLPPSSLRETTLAFALPVFNAGRVQAGIDMQDAASQRAELRYEQAIRQAAQDVESALAGLRQSQARAMATDQVVLARQRAKATAQRLFDEGQISGLDRIALEQAHALAQLNQTESQESAWQAFIQLHRALGGGWQQATHATANTASASTEHQP